MNRTEPSHFPFIVKIAILVFVFGVFPVFVAVVAINYKNKADGLLESQNPQADQAASQGGSAFETGAVKILTEDQVNTLDKVNIFMVGRWVSLQDKKYIVEISPNGTFTDKDGKTLVAYGTWGSFVSSTSSSNVLLGTAASQNIDGVNNTDSSYYLYKTHSEEKYKNQKFIYEIMQLDSDRAILYYTGNDKILYFAREVSEATATTSTAQ